MCGIDAAARKIEKVCQKFDQKMTSRMGTLGAGFWVETAHILADGRE
jgi:hypothetical protein